MTTVKRLVTLFVMVVATLLVGSTLAVPSASAAGGDTFTVEQAKVPYRAQLCRVQRANEPFYQAVWRGRDRVSYKLFKRRLPTIRRQAARAEAVYLDAYNRLRNQPKRWPVNIRNDMGMLTNSLNRQRDDLFRLGYTAFPRAAWRELGDWNGRQPVFRGIRNDVERKLGVRAVC